MKVKKQTFSFLTERLTFPIRHGLFLGFIIQWLCILPSSAQDPVFSQFYLSPLQLNPALSGLTDDPRFSANYRNQFPGFNNAYRTYALSYDQFFSGFHSGIG